MKLGPINLEIIGLQQIIYKKTTKLTQAKHIARRASLSCGLNSYKVTVFSFINIFLSADLYSVFPLSSLVKHIVWFLFLYLISLHS